MAKIQANGDGWRGDAPSPEPWPSPPPPPIARACRLIEVVTGDRIQAAGLLSFRVRPGHTAEIHFRQAGVDADGSQYPTERIAFGPADARELLRDLASVVAELDEIEPKATPPKTDQRIR